MLILIGFLLPLMVFVLAGAAAQLWLHKWPFLNLAACVTAAASVAVWATLAVLYATWIAPEWAEGTRIVWTSIGAANGPVVLGGPKETAVIGWPHGAFAPAVTVDPGAGDVATLRGAGGSAFVFDHQADEFINGRPIAIDSTVQVGRFAVRLTKPWYRIATQQVEIVGEQDRVLSRFLVPHRFVQSHRVISVKQMVDRGHDLEGADVQTQRTLMELRRWSEEVYLLVTSEGAVRVLDASDTWERSVRLPFDGTMYWYRTRLPIQVKRSSAGLVVDFPPPWRRPCPVPPAASDGALNLVVTSQVRPGEFAYTLPFGGALSSVHAPLTLSRLETGAVVFTGPSARAVADEQSDKLLPPGVRIESVGLKNVTSEVSVGAGTMSLKLVTARDLPEPGAILPLLVIAVAVYWLGLLLVAPRLSDPVTRWIVLGLSTVIWVLLSIRLLLALRYALAPDTLDLLATKGLAMAVAWLVAIPGVLLFVAALRHDFPERGTGRAKWIGFGLNGSLLLAVAGGAVLTFSRVSSLWPNLPPQYVPTLGWGETLFLTLVFSYLVMSIVALYFLDGSRLARGLRRLLLAPWYAADTYLGVSPAKGRSSETSRAVAEKPAGLRGILGSIRNGPGFWEEVADLKPLRFGANALLLVALVTVGAVLFVGMPFFLSLAPFDELLQDVVVPVVSCWSVAVLWVACAVRFAIAPPKAPFKSWMSRVLVLAFATFIGAVVLVPICTGDPGAIYANLALFILLTSLLLATRAWQCGLAFMVPALLFAVAFAFGYANIESLPGVPDTARVRLLAFREGTDVQGFVLFSNVSSKNDDGIPFEGLVNAYQHTWENLAMAHEGGLTGFGFGIAPNRNSEIRQDTLQYDSVFSFFVLGDHGWIGGASLLGIHALPLLLVIVGGWRRFDAGYAIAALIAGALLLEALVHAAMNVGLIPFTGRNMPLLSVNSISDVSRWTLFMAFAVQCLFWRCGGLDRPATSAILLFEPAIARPRTSTVPVHESGENAEVAVDVTADVAAAWTRRGAYAAPFVLLLVPALVGLGVVARGLVVVGSDELEKPLSFDGLQARVKHLIDAELITVNAEGLIQPDTNQLRLNPHDLVQQQIDAFNAMTIEERLEGERSEAAVKRLAAVSDLAGFDTAMDEMRRGSGERRPGSEPNLFRLIAAERAAADGITGEPPLYQLQPNPDFNFRLSFQKAASPDDLPKVTYRDGKTMLLGPAWVRGRWVAAAAPDQSVPWLPYLQTALDAESSDARSAQQATDRYGKLTLDHLLQRSAVDFAAAKGREQHQGLVRKSPLAPARVAISVLDLPRGEVLALGGWPRMSSSDTWARTADGEWLPPARWLAEVAPRTLRLRYEGDRNFDRMFMGSASKPLWAAAVLSLHPELAKQLRVQGPGGDESEVFGIRLDKTWSVQERLKWVDLTNYLAASDNRFHIRLGFLGLADRTESGIADAGESPSDRESISPGQPSPWRKYPRFSASIGFSQLNSGELTNLRPTPLAERLRSMFAVGAGAKDLYGRRFSFWSKSEVSDLAHPDADDEHDFATFLPISPQSPNFQFDSVTSPGQFVNLLLGGENNLWSNVDFGAAFATCVTGRPVGAHIVMTSKPFDFLESRTEFVETAALLRPGLAGVVEPATKTKLRGTAYQGLTESGGRAVLGRLGPNVEVYAKTGTLLITKGFPETSRITLAIVRWKDKKKGIVASGLVFSVVAEYGGEGKAPRWLGEFLVQNERDIRRLLDEPGAPS